MATQRKAKGTEELASAPSHYGDIVGKGDTDGNGEGDDSGEGEGEGGDTHWRVDISKEKITWGERSVVESINRSPSIDTIRTPPTLCGVR